MAFIDLQAGMNKDLTIFKQAWGVEWVIKILDAYSLLQVGFV